MKNTRKILLALVLVLAMIMSFATVSAFAADESGAETKTIYFSNNKGWSKVNAYYWGGTSTVGWPGTAMEKVDTNDYGEDIYAITVSADTTYIIFNNGSEQTVDIKLNSAVNAYSDALYAAEDSARELENAKAELDKLRETNATLTETNIKLLEKVKYQDDTTGAGGEDETPTAETITIDDLFKED